MGKLKAIIFTILFLFTFGPKTLHAKAIAPKTNQYYITTQTKFTKANLEKRRPRDGRFKRKKGFLGLFKGKGACDCPK
jgi:hypothetical protein